MWNLKINDTNEITYKIETDSLNVLVKVLTFASGSKCKSLSCIHGILQAFPTQGSNSGVPHFRQILYQLSHKGSPRILEWVAHPLSSGSSPPRNWTGVSWIAGRFFINWAIREAKLYVTTDIIILLHIFIYNNKLIQKVKSKPKWIMTVYPVCLYTTKTKSTWK